METKRLSSFALAVCCTAAGCGEISAPHDRETLPSAVTLSQHGEITLVDLGTPLGTDNAHAQAINQRGDVVGTGFGEQGAVAFLWSEQHGFTDLGTLGGPFPEPAAINARGQVVGSAVAVVNGVNRRHAFLWSARDGMRDLTPDAFFSAAAGINDAGVVVGVINLPPTGSGPRPFLWTEQDGITVLEVLPGWGGGQALDINNAGQVVGHGAVPTGSSIEIHVFLWDRRQGMRDLGVIGAAPGDGRIGPRAINERGEVVGTLRDATGTLRAFLWTEEDGITELGPAGSTSSVALDINDLGQVVGAFDLLALPFNTIGGTAYVWSRGAGFVELPHLGDGVSAARGINNAGDIVGDSSAPNAGPHAVIWKVRGWF